MKKFYLAALLPLLLLSTSCLEQDALPKVPGVDGPKLNVQNGQIVLSVGLENVDLPAGISLTIPKMRYSSATISPRMMDDGMVLGTVLKVSFDPRDVDSDEFKVVPPEQLPDGRPFPFTVDGTLPALAINIPKLLDTTFYASEKVFGFFIPVNLGRNVDIPFDIPFRLKMSGKNIGIVSYIRKNPEGDGDGIVLMLTMSQLRANPDMQALLKHSKRYKSKVF